MDKTGKIIVIVCALLINILIWLFFQETVLFEHDTANYSTTFARYDGESHKKCFAGDCTYKFIYHFTASDNNSYQITSSTPTNVEPVVGSTKLVKYDKQNPNLAFFSKANVQYLFYLIEFALLFVVLWVCFSKPKKVEVYVDGNVVQMEHAGPKFYYGQAIIAAIFSIICVFFYISMGTALKTFNPITILRLTNPAGFVLICLLAMGIIMTVWSYKSR